MSIHKWKRGRGIWEAAGGNREEGVTGWRWELGDKVERKETEGGGSGV